MATGVNNPKIREVLNQQVLQTYEFAVPTADPDWFKTSTVLAAQTTTLLAAAMTKDYAPGIPVVPVLVLTNSIASGETKWTSATATWSGKDQFGNGRVATTSFTDASPTWTATCPFAMSEFVSVAFTITGGTAADGSDTYVMGFVKQWGLGCAIGKDADVILHNFDGTKDAGTISTASNTYLIAGTPNGTKLLRLWIRSTVY